MTSVFLQFELASPAVWLYVTVSLAVAVFFQFARPFTLRNWDLLGLFLFAPGLLLLEEARRMSNGSLRYAGYSWLLIVSGLWMIRCFLDARLQRRTRVSPNLARVSLFWLAGTLLVGLGLGTATKPVESATIGQRPAVLNGMEQTATAVVHQVQPDDSISADMVRIWVSRSLAIACQIAVVVLLVLICWLHFHDPTTAASAAILYLIIPATAFFFDQSHHVWPTALLLGAVLAYRKPHIAGILLGLSAGTAFFPLMLFPCWHQFYRNRGAARFSLWFFVSGGAAFLVSALSLYLAGDYTSGIWQTLNLTDWQPWRVPRAESVWTGGRWVYRLPLFLAYLGFVTSTFIWPSARNLGQLLAMSAAVLLGIQFWFADRGGVYVLWYAPLLILVMLRPTTLDHIPPPIEDGQLFGWLRKRPTTQALPSPSLAI